MFEILHGGIHLSQNIGTHHIQNIKASSWTTGGRVNISCTFTEHSRAMGYLTILKSKAISSQEIFVVANRDDTLSGVLNISIPRVPPGDYTIYVFDLESSGLPVLSTATNPYVRSAGERDNITVIEQGYDEGIV